MFYRPIVLPLLAMVGLTFGVWFYLFARRIPEIFEKKIDVRKLKDRAEAHALMPASAAASNNLKNLFELPVLFYLAGLLSMILLIQDPVLVWLSWAFVGLRAAHSLIHCTYNDVNHRFAAYAVSCMVLLFIWVRLGSWIFLS
ncbi:MAG: MAPEG family protein [Lysobacterales bacterium]|jgi:hypothetical protein